MDATFSMANMLPQTPALNRAVWEKLESIYRKFAERMRRRRMTRYLKDTITGKIYAWTEHLSQMERMQDLGWHEQKYTDVSKL